VLILRKDGLSDLTCEFRNCLKRKKITLFDYGDCPFVLYLSLPKWVEDLKMAAHWKI